SRRFLSVVTLVMFAAGATLTAQTDIPDRSEPSTPVPAREPGTTKLRSPPLFDSSQLLQQPAGAPPTPRHTGVKAMAREIVTDVKYIPSRENLMWAGIGGGLALAAHPFDDNVNAYLVGNETAEKIFKPGAIIGQF